jgi:4'-phosphopantetheinyl transferase
MMGAPPVVVHVSYSPASAWTAESLARDEALLEPDERERSSRFRFDRDRRMYIAAHALLRRALSKRAEVDPATWRFVRSEHGRPEIAEPSSAARLRFSLSHTRAVAACAVTSDLEVGFDIEDLRRAPVEVADRFAPSERADILSCRADERDERFFRYWTLKESYLKGRGLGLALALDQVVFDLGSGTVWASLGADCADDARAWRFESWTIEGSYTAALAVRSQGPVRIVTSPG